MFYLVSKMDEIVPHEDTIEICTNLTYNRNEIIAAQIGSGNVIYKGVMGGYSMPVAVKRIQRVDIQTKNIQTFKDYIERRLEHPNIVRYFKCETNEDFL